MSLLRRRLMMQTSEIDPRKRMEFYNAGDIIAVTPDRTYTKTYSSINPMITCFGIVKLGNRYCVVIVRSIKATWAYDMDARNGVNISGHFEAMDPGWPGVITIDGNYYFKIEMHSVITSFPSYGDAVDYTNQINVNSIPIINEITGKEYVSGYSEAGGSRLECIEITVDMLNYYLGVI